jgi:hypothetical protein
MKEEYKDGVYKSETAVYFIKGDRIIMRLNGGCYKTNPNFMQGKYHGELPPEISDQFDGVFEKCPYW